MERRKVNKGIERRIAGGRQRRMLLYILDDQIRPSVGATRNGVNNQIEPVDVGIDVIGDGRPLVVRPVVPGV